MLFITPSSWTRQEPKFRHVCLMSWLIEYISPHPTHHQRNSGQLPEIYKNTRKGGYSDIGIWTIPRYQNGDMETTNYHCSSPVCKCMMKTIVMIWHLFVIIRNTRRHMNSTPPFISAIENVQRIVMTTPPGDQYRKWNIMKFINALVPFEDNRKVSG